MAERSPNWDVEIIPGAKRVRRGVAAVIDFARFPRSDGYPSDHRHVEEAPRPGEIGGVIAEPTLVELPIVDDRQPRLEFPTD